MRVLYFTRDYTTHDMRFLERLASSSFEMHYIRLESDGIPYEQRPLPAGVRSVPWDGGKHPAKTLNDWLGLMPSFQRVLDDLQPDLVHAGPVQSCGFMTAVAGVHPFLVTSWGSDILVDADRDDLWRWLTRYTLQRSDALLCDCDTVRRKAQQYVAYPDERVVQFPWGVNLRTFRPGDAGLAIKSALGWEDKRVFLSTRAWESLYGIDILLEAFRRAYECDTSLRLLMLATGSLSVQVAAFITEYHLGDVVHCAGQVSHADLARYFQASDAYISCAHSDGTSISLLEALATGIPTVVTDIPSNREWVTPGVHGWLGADGDASSFAIAILNAARLTPAERAHMAEQNRALAEARADWDRNVEKLVQAYEDLTRTGV